MNTHRSSARFSLGVSTLVAALLAACGGGADEALPEAPEMQPLFELAQALPPEPSDIDADGNSASAALAPGRATLLGDPAAAGDDADSLRKRVQGSSGNVAGRGEGTASIQAAASAAVYYTVAQMRAAYGLDQLPAANSSNKGAYQGSGQTIAIVGAYHNPTAAADLAVFSQKFGLPTCATVAVAATATLPLIRPAAGSACSFSVVHATAAGGMTTRVPAGNASWRTESALDIQWAHAMAPQARIILVQAATASGNDIMGAIALANKLGATVVSMSFGAREFASQGSYDKSLFNSSGVTYLAASGDSGRAVSWPAVSPKVLAVGGTTLAYSSGVRNETGWSGSGGGLSAYSGAPAWQSTVNVTDTTGRVAAPMKRALPDVAFNANPNSGQMVYVAPATGTNGWVIAGGTSIGAPQWAGLVAVANATRALAGKPALGNNLSNTLYRNVGAVPASYAATLLDVTSGANGTCKGCGSTTGYDLVTGLGTPHAMRVIDLLGAL